MARIVFIGAGKLANGLAPALFSAGYKISQVYSRTEKSASVSIPGTWIAPSISFVSSLAEKSPEYASVDLETVTVRNCEVIESGVFHESGLSYIPKLVHDSKLGLGRVWLKAMWLKHIKTRPIVTFFIFLTLKW